MGEALLLVWIRFWFWTSPYGSGLDGWGFNARRGRWRWGLRHTILRKDLLGGGFREAFFFLVTILEASFPFFQGWVGMAVPRLAT